MAGRNDVVPRELVVVPITAKTGLMTTKSTTVGREGKIIHDVAITNEEGAEVIFEGTAEDQLKLAQQLIQNALGLEREQAAKLVVEGRSRGTLENYLNDDSIPPISQQGKGLEASRRGGGIDNGI